MWNPAQIGKMPKLKNLMALWREIFPVIKSEKILIAADEILIYENIPSAEKFTALKFPCRQTKKSPENLTEKLSAAKSELYNHNDDKAFELFA